MPASTAPVRSPARRRVLRRRLRRIGAALLAGAAAASLAAAVAPPPPPTEAVVVAVHDLPAGAVVTAADVAVAPWPRGARPDGAATAPAEAVGAVLSGALRRGEPLTDARRLGPGLLAGQPPGTVLVALALSDAGALPSLSPGRRIDVLARAGDPVTGAAGPAERVATDVVVLALPAPPAASGFLPGSGTAPATLLLGVDEETARRLASTAGGWTGVVLRS
ncbi:Flp pilus assembly protein CpaB [Kineococcus xinjiangensis]|uniref:Flp pilus assembly protein CpaB n=1 Tax=Kineococcus xinjiangensis TaxID=512762 RepID=A0A2S6ISR6_9ACTN|nr:SAF domain-containing protein [Kineococcus xinjiangensis]PPK97292.1 Flp pilus assembly protein CpaB [Kineococcus xinjiangensis]